MPDREKVIKALELCSDALYCADPSSRCSQCPYRTKDMTGADERNCSDILMADALDLLKEQEARILDWDELEDWGNAVWFEDNDEHECYIALIANVGAYDAKFTNVEPGNIHSLVFMRDFYMKEWRCWSARPTTKQRQDVKWG